MIDIRIVPAAAVRPMRSEVLRPGIPPDALVYPMDDAAETRHFAAFLGDRIVGIASLYHAPPPESTDAGAWQLRGMATAPDQRGRGHGAALVRACMTHAAGRAGTSLWFNARVVALGFYEKLGFRTIGPEFDIPGVGPHYLMAGPLG